MWKGTRGKGRKIGVTVTPISKGGNDMGWGRSRINIGSRRRRAKMKKEMSIKLRIAQLEKENAEMKKELGKEAKKQPPKKEIIDKVSDKEIFDRLWKRCRSMESQEYFWFKQMSKVVNWYGKELSPKQRESLRGIVQKYWNAEETPKPKKKSQLNPHK